MPYGGNAIVGSNPTSTTTTTTRTNFAGWQPYNFAGWQPYNFAGWQPTFVVELSTAGPGARSRLPACC